MASPSSYWTIRATGPGRAEGSNCRTQCSCRISVLRNRDHRRNWLMDRTTGAPKDFDVGGVPLEVKARRGTAAPYIAISSEHQLDMPVATSMYLYVGEITRATDLNDEWFTLTMLFTMLVNRFSLAILPRSLVLRKLFPARAIAMKTITRTIGGLEANRGGSKYATTFHDCELRAVRKGLARCGTGSH